MERYECDAISSGYLLRCVSPLLQSDRYRLHPPLYTSGELVQRSNGNGSKAETAKDICQVYSEYESCAPSELRERCRNLISHTEKIYEYICGDSEVRANLTDQVGCLSKLDQDLVVTTCERNAATALKHVASTRAMAIEKRHAMQCDVVQKYIDCARPKYVKECGEYVWLIKGEALELTTAHDEMRCNFTLMEPKIPGRGLG